jgi:hypothetical protein
MSSPPKSSSTTMDNRRDGLTTEYCHQIERAVRVSQHQILDFLRHGKWL